MSVTYTTEISAPVANYPSIVEFSAAIRATYSPDTETLLQTAQVAGDCSDPITTVAEEAGGFYKETFTSIWIDQATLDAHHSDPSIADELVTLESLFTVVRNAV